MAFPFEFKVEGPPVSQQTHDRAGLQAWKDIVRAEAMRLWLERSPVTNRLMITVVYYHEGEETNIDNDNMLKPIQDALNGIIYVDDKQIIDTRVRRTSLDGKVTARYMPQVVADGFVRGVPFVYVRVEDAPNHAEILR